MVDVIKFQPSVSNTASNIQNLRYKSNSQQFNLPGFLAKCYTFVENEHIKHLPTKHWIDLCPQNPSRLLDVSNLPYSLHRKVMYQELSRTCTTTTMTHLNRPFKSKQQCNTNKTTTTTTAAAAAVVGESNTTSQPSFFNSDVQSCEIFNSLSKYITVKAEPLRPPNSVVKGPTNTITSWQKYWASTYAQRRRKETIDSDFELSRSKFEKTTPGQTQFVVVRDENFPKKIERLINEETVSMESISCSLTKVSTTAMVDEKIHLTEGNDINGLTNQVSSIELIGSSIVPSSAEINSSRRILKSTITAPPPATDKNDDKSRRKNSSFERLSSSSIASNFRSVSQAIGEVVHAQNTVVPMASKVLQMSVISEKNKTNKHSATRSRSRSKSSEKKIRRIPSAAKRKRQMSGNGISSHKTKQTPLSAVMPTTPRAKYSYKKWDSPYTGLRFDPPTPPSSPSLNVLPQDSDEEDNPTSFEKSEIFEHNSTIKVLKRCAF
ncbi:unnamed protein product [Rotaria magnacalcarata]|uniref:Uncharacterized protein n=1 Tax=Rotaria magnacalcarata TaxID=392030 RepID=A0A816AEH1_9BILA|nr:unnamed protein product [Rotaria magnacalcarata]CAF1593953.1 unnamed protein product [Rotaria magnacalcarata]CAF2025203.1 unnamed protein product [Rotaria magnacalcarata]CAF3781974.1 unnamed protein product [Rotaria magnacalcarata]CAF3798075.1 unnamed protein product [Rotaria magnacalcarata]